MTVTELVQRLGEMYGSAPHGEVSTAVHLFGIRHAEDIRASGASVAAIVRQSEVPDSYITEVHKGVALSRYVVERTPPDAPMPAKAGWVAEVAMAHPLAVFDTLRDQVVDDIQEFQALPKRYTGIRGLLQVTSHGDAFAVGRTSGSRAEVTVAMNGSVIVVEGPRLDIAASIVGIGDDGRVRLDVQSTRSGHVSQTFGVTCAMLSRLILEPMMFS